MSSDESSPLLPRIEDQTLSVPHEHPIFLRVAHSPWTFVGQKTLLTSRLISMVYTTVVWAATLHRDIKSDGDNAKLFPFKADNISLTLQAIYFWVTTIWTLQHLRSPRNRPQREGGNFITRAPGRALSFFSIPRTTEWTPGKKFAFSMFYTSAATFPFVTSFLHYAVLGDRHRGHWKGDIQHDWLDFSLHGVNSVLAAFEVLLMSSVRQIKPFVGHALAMAVTPGLYFLWAGVGHLLTGDYPYDQVDPSNVDPKTMLFNVVTSMALGTAGFLAVQGLHEGRDILAEKAECDRSY
ncbi:MAG: hypothetical protein MMC23_004526 [Stictis urceolatum]|nr:hypothetical protein [Stictis urceolata]